MDITLLIIALVMYCLGMIIALYFDVKWLFMILGMLWFIPIFMIDNIFIITFSATMVVSNAMLGFRKGESEV